MACSHRKTVPKLQEPRSGDIYPNGFKGPDGLARPGFFQDGNKVIRAKSPRSIPAVAFVAAMASRRFQQGRSGRHLGLRPELASG
jgi:hypothetical protein